MDYYKKSIAIEEELGDQYGIAINYPKLHNAQIGVRNFGIGK